MANAALLALPRELRDQIYHYVLHHGEGVILDITNKPRLTLRHALALAQTNQQLRHETSTLFFSINTIHITPVWPARSSRSWGVIRLWLSSIGQDNCAALKHVNLRLETWFPRPLRGETLLPFEEPSPALVAVYIKYFRSIDVQCTFTLNVQYSDIPRLGCLQIEQVDLAAEADVFPAQTSALEHALLRQADAVQEMIRTGDDRVDGHVVIRLLMGLNRCRNSFADFLSVVRAGIEGYE